MVWGRLESPGSACQRLGIAWAAPEGTRERGGNASERLGALVCAPRCISLPGILAARARNHIFLQGEVGGA